MSSLPLAGYNNKKTRANEIVQVNFDNISVTTSEQTTAFLKTIADEFDTQIPLHTEILGNYPNPFNPSTKFMFSFAEDAEVQIKVYNIIGQEVVVFLTTGRLGESKLWNGMGEILWAAESLPVSISFC